MRIGENWRDSNLVVMEQRTFVIEKKTNIRRSTEGEKKEEQNRKKRLGAPSIFQKHTIPLGSHNSLQNQPIKKKYIRILEAFICQRARFEMRTK